MTEINRKNLFIRSTCHSVKSKFSNEREYSRILVEFSGQFFVIVNIFNVAAVGHGHVGDRSGLTTVVPFCAFPVNVGAVYIVLDVLVSHVVEQSIAANGRLIHHSTTGKRLNFRYSRLSFLLPWFHFQFTPRWLRILHIHIRHYRVSSSPRKRMEKRKKNNTLDTNENEWSMSVEDSMNQNKITFTPSFFLLHFIYFGLFLFLFHELSWQLIVVSS